MLLKTSGVRRAINRKKRANSAEFWSFLNSPFGLALLSGVFIAGVGGFYNHARQAELDQRNRISSARKLLSESRFRLNEVRFRAKQIGQTADVGQKQGLSRYIYGAAMGVNDFTPGVAEYKGHHWAGVLIELDSFVHVDGYVEATQATQDLEQGFNNNGFNYFENEFLEVRIQTLAEYHVRVEAKLKSDDESRSWFSRKVLS